MVAKKKVVRKKAAPKKRVIAKKRAAPKKKVAFKQPPRRKIKRPDRVSKKKAAPRASGVGSGGKRKNSGRKVGAATQRTREAANKLAAEAGITPLEHMLGVLNESPDDLRQQLADNKISEAEYLILLKGMIQRKDWAAQQAAPYIHPRLSSIEHDDGKDRHEEFLDNLDD